MHQVVMLTLSCSVNNADVVFDFPYKTFLQIVNSGCSKDLRKSFVSSPVGTTVASFLSKLHKVMVVYASAAVNLRPGEMSETLFIIRAA